MNAAMNAWSFVIAAYAVAIVGTVGLVLWAAIVLRRAEKRADALDRQQKP